MKDAKVFDSLLLCRGLKFVLFNPRACLAVSFMISPVQNNIFESAVLQSLEHNSAVLQKQSADRKGGSAAMNWNLHRRESGIASG